MTVGDTDLSSDNNEHEFRALQYGDTDSSSPQHVVHFEGVAAVVDERAQDERVSLQSGRGW